MSSQLYIGQIVQELGDLIEAVWTRKANLEAEEPRYKSLRQRLYALEPLIGPPPKFVHSAKSLRDLWRKTVKGEDLSTYDSRREFLATEYFDYYQSKMGQVTERNFEEALALRDLAILRQIGEGGFSAVFEVEHMVLRERRAVKKLDPIFANEEHQENALRRFLREVRILGEISHENIVKFIDAGIAGGSPFIVTEYVKGKDLQALVNAKGVPQPGNARTIMNGALAAVKAAHSVGVVHRDIKPSNVMWTGEKAVVLDFGAGQWIERQLTTRMTTTAIGTPGYIADELFENPLLLEPSLDCFSLGVFYHFLLAGRIPSRGDSSYYLRECGFGTVVQEFVRKALAPPKERFADAVKMAEAFKGLGDDQAPA